MALPREPVLVPQLGIPAVDWLLVHRRVDVHGTPGKVMDVADALMNEGVSHEERRELKKE